MAKKPQNKLLQSALKRAKEEKIEYKTRSFRLPSSLIERLEAEAARVGENPNNLLRLILEEALN